VISIIKEMIRDRKYKPDPNIIKSNKSMGPYIREGNNLVVLIARSFIGKWLLGTNTYALTKKDISCFTFDYCKPIQEEII